MFDVFLAWARDHTGDDYVADNTFYALYYKKPDLIALAEIPFCRPNKSLPDWAFFVF